MTTPLQTSRASIARAAEIANRFLGKRRLPDFR